MSLFDWGMLACAEIGVGVVVGLLVFLVVLGACDAWQYYTRHE